MRFAKIVFSIAAIWGVLVITPLHFMFDLIGLQNPDLLFLKARAHVNEYQEFLSHFESSQPHLDQIGEARTALKRPCSRLSLSEEHWAAPGSKTANLCILTAIYYRH